MRRIKKNGFSLIELMIYSLILGGFLLLVSQVFISVKTINANSLILVNIQRSFRQIVSEVTRSVRMASEVTEPAAGGTSTQLVLDGGDVVFALSPDGVFQKTENGIVYDLTSNEASISGLVVTNPVEATQSGTVRLQMLVSSRYHLTGGRQLVEELDFAAGVR